MSADNFSVPDDIKKVALQYILASSGAPVPHPDKVDRLSYTVSYSYYGSSLKFSKSQTKKFLKLMREGEIDWDKTAEPRDTMEAQFSGTFAETTEYDYIMYQDIVFTDGTVIRIACEHEQTTFGSVLRGMLAVNKSIDELLDALEETLNSEMASWLFDADEKAKYGSF